MKIDWSFIWNTEMKYVTFRTIFLNMINFMYTAMEYSNFNCTKTNKRKRRQRDGCYNYLSRETQNSTFVN